MYLIDTDVLSALRRRERHPAVAKWVGSQKPGDLYLSVVSVGEIERGIVRKRKTDPHLANKLAAWLDTVVERFGNTILDVDVRTARRWGTLTAEVGHRDFDLLIAATAFEHRLTVATGNVKHFAPTGVRVFDPFSRSHAP